MAAKRHISTGPAVVFYLIAMALIVAMLSLVNVTTCRDMFGSLKEVPLVKIFFNHLGDAILLLAPYWVLKRRRRTYALVVMWIVALWSFAQLLYYPNYHDLMPFSSFLLVENISPTLVRSTVGSVGKASLMVLAAPLVGHVAAWWLKRKELPGTVHRRRWWLAVASLVAWIVLRATVTTCIYLTNRHNYSDLRDAFNTRYCHLGGRHRNYLMHNGAVAYGLYCLCSTFESTVSDKDLQEAARFVEQDCDHHAATAREDTPNVIFIMVESLNAWAVNLTIDGRPVTPTLNALAADTTANLVCLNVIAQVKNGRSSDGKFIYQTGLLPLPDKAVAMEFSDRTFPSLTKILKNRGYATFEICGDEQGLWNIEHMSQCYGFDTLYHQPELAQVLKAADYKSDKAVVDFTLNLMPRLQQPFFLQLFTGVMHSPYTDDWQPTTWISRSKQYTVPVRNYLEKTAYFDTQLGIFLRGLEQMGLNRNTIVVIASDHNEWVDDDPAGRPAISPAGNECVLLVMGSGTGKAVKGPVGQVDVYPTLLDILGGGDGRWRGLGHSLLQGEVKSAAVNGYEVVGDKHSPLVPQQLKAWPMSEILIKSDFFKTHPTLCP